MLCIVNHAVLRVPTDPCSACGPGFADCRDLALHVGQLRDTIVGHHLMSSLQGKYVRQGPATSVNVLVFGKLVNVCVRESCVPRFRQEPAYHGAVSAAASSGVHSELSERFVDKDGNFLTP